MLKTLHFKHCKVVIWNEMYMETVFEDGLTAPALYIFDDDSNKLAKLMGYGHDVRQLHREHDIAHTFLAEAEGKLYSPVLRGVATR